MLHPTTIWKMLFFPVVLVLSFFVQQTFAGEQSKREIEAKERAERRTLTAAEIRAAKQEQAGRYQHVYAGDARTSMVVYTNRPNKAIPDNTPGGVRDTIATPALTNLGYVSIRLDTLLHTWVGDLIIRIQAPNGDVATLVNRAGSGTFGSSGDNFIGTALTDFGYRTIESIVLADTPHTGFWRPDSNLSRFQLASMVAGNWIITVVDTAGGDVGTLVRWSVVIEANEIVPPNIVHARLRDSLLTTNRVAVATITDTSGIASGANAPRLMWKLSTSGTYTPAAVDSVSGNNRYFTIPGQPLGSIVQYYIAAQDNAPTSNSGTLPFGGSGSPPGATAPPKVFSYVVAGPPLSGTYTIGAAGNYTTLSAAVSDLTTRGVSAPVTFLFTDAAYSDTAQIITPYTGQGTTNTVTFKPAASATPRIVFAGGSATNTGIAVRMDSVRGIVWDGSNSGGTDRSMTIESDTNTTTARTPFFIRKGSRNVTLKNMIIKGNRHSAGGIPSVVVIDNAGFATSGGQHNITITNCQLMRGNNGLFQNAASGAVRDSNHTFTNNLIGGGSSVSLFDHLASQGITMTGNHNVLVADNDVNGIKNGAATVIGISVRGANTAVTVTRNRIHNLVTTGGAFRPLCILVGNIIATGPPVKTRAVISNNMIYDIHNFGVGAAGRSLSGFIYNPTGGANSPNGNGSTIQWYYNSMNVEYAAGEGGPSTNSVYSFDGNFAGITDQPDSIIHYNNIYSIKRADTLSVRHFLILQETVPGNSKWLSNNNVYYNVVGPNSAVFAQIPSPFPSGSAVSVPDLAAFRDSTRLDSASVFGNPQFVSATDAHIRTDIPTPVESRGRPIAGITTDFDSQTRNATTPDIGADEGNFIPVGAVHDIGVASLTRTSANDAPSSLPKWKTELMAAPALLGQEREAVADAREQLATDFTAYVAATAASTISEALKEANAALDVQVGTNLTYAAMADTARFRAIIQNYGSFPETTYQVRLTVDGATISTVNNTRILAPSGRDTFNLAWNTGTPGAHVARVFTLLGTDVNGANDTATVNFTIGPPSTTEQFKDHVTSAFRATVTNEGTIGSLNAFVGTGPGSGFQFNPVTAAGQRLFGDGIMIGLDSTRVSDGARTTTGTYDADFKFLTTVDSSTSGIRTTMTTSYADSLAETPFGARVNQRTVSWDSVGLNNFLIFELDVVNTSATPWTTLHAGGLLDWDVQAAGNDRGAVIVDSTNTIPGVNGGNPFAFDMLELHQGASPNSWMGIVPLNENRFRGRRIAISSSEIYGPAHPTNGDKWRYMTSNRATNPDGDAGTATDHAQVFGSGPYSVASGGTKRIGFAMFGGTSLANAVAAARAAQQAWVQRLGNTINVVAPPAPGWTVRTSGTTSFLQSVRQVNANVIWAGGNAATVLKSVDGGATWTNGNSTPGVITGDIYNIDALDANTAFVTTSPAATFIYRTTNGGTNWTQVFTQTGGFIDAIHMYNATTGIALGDPVGGTFTIVGTTDGGATWTRVPAANEPVPVGGETGLNNSLSTVGTTHIWFGSSIGPVWRSTNSGATWTRVATTFTGNNLEVHFNNTLNGVTGNSTGLANRSTDGGATWVATTIAGTGGVNGLSGAGYEFFASKGTNVYRSTDRGATWAVSYTGAIGALSHLDFFATGTTAAASFYGTAVSTTGGIATAFLNLVTGVKEATAELPTVFSLAQNYPNPFNPSTTIRYGLPEAARVNLSIYNMLGQRVAELTNEEESAGFYNAVWNGHNQAGAQVATGVYFYRIEATPVNGGAPFISLKKALLLK